MRIPILTRRDFDFSALAAGAASGAIPVAPNLDQAREGRGELRMRVHTATLPTGSTFRLDVRLVAPTPDDPAVFFAGPLVATAVVTASSASPPQLVVCPLAQHLGATLAFFLTAQQGTSQTAFRFAISADLILDVGICDWSPLDLGNRLTLFVDQHDLVEVSSAYSAWGDQSPASNDFSQGTAAARPAVGATVNTFPSPDFDGSNDYLGAGNLSSFVPATAYHVFAVFRAQTISGTNGTSYFNNGVIADGNAGWWGLYLRTSGGTPQVIGFHYASGDMQAVATGLRLGVDSLVEWSYDGTTIRCQVGGEPVASVAAGSIGSLGNPVRIGHGSGSALYLDGAVASIVVCNAYLSDAERSSVRGYLAAKYGVAS